MSVIAILVILVIGIPLLIFVVWQFMQEAIVRVDSGSVGLLVVRGKATDKVLTPGAHLVWPFRQQMIQGYPLRELTYLTTDGSGGVESSDYADPPLQARLGDRAAASVLYTIRFRIRPDGLREIHERVGPDGIKQLVRDHSRRVLIDELAAEERGIDDAFGDARHLLEEALAARISTTLQECGFEVELFNLRALQLGTIDDVVEATLRAKAELELEKASAKVRDLRVKNETATTKQLVASLTDELLRYRQIELGRDALRRWDGRVVLGDAAIARAIGPTVASGDAGDTPTNTTTNTTTETTAPEETVS